MQSESEFIYEKRVDLEMNGFIIQIVLRMSGGHFT